MSYLSGQTKLKNAKEFMKRVRETKKPTLGIRSFQHPTKGPILVRTLAVPTLDENQKIIEILAYDENMTDRRTLPRD